MFDAKQQLTNKDLSKLYVNAERYRYVCEVQ